MPAIIAIFCLAAALILLLALSAIDLKHKILPDMLVLPFLILGPVFHFATSFQYAVPVDMLGGLLLGGGLLYAVRMGANRLYDEDTLGLGDVKLLAAAGVWLGLHDIVTAIILGAAAGIFHGLAIAVSIALKTKAPVNLKTLSLPAGPGFAVGIVITAIIKFWNLPEILLL